MLDAIAARARRRQPARRPLAPGDADATRCAATRSTSALAGALRPGRALRPHRAEYGLDRLDVRVSGARRSSAAGPPGWRPPAPTARPAARARSRCSPPSRRALRAPAALQGAPARRDRRRPRSRRPAWYAEQRRRAAPRGRGRGARSRRARRCAWPAARRWPSTPACSPPAPSRRGCPVPGADDPSDPQPALAARRARAARPRRGRALGRRDRLGLHRLRGRRLAGDARAAR